MAACPCSLFAVPGVRAVLGICAALLAAIPALAANLWLPVPALAEETAPLAVTATPLVWLAPACILAGMGLQLALLAIQAPAPRARASRRHPSRSSFPLRGWRLGIGAPGVALVLFGAALDRDACVAVGQCAALLALWLRSRACARGPEQHRA